MEPSYRAFKVLVQYDVTILGWRPLPSKDNTEKLK
jgi:hypothetical protein